jgi:small subunit ribosomal protein S18
MADETKAPEQSAPSERPRNDGPRPGGDRPSGDRPRFGGGGGGRGPGGPPREGGRKFFRRKKVCKFCTEKIEDINYKDYRMPRRLTGVCAPHQHRLSSAIKQARNIALLPFAGRAS